MLIQPIQEFITTADEAGRVHFNTNEHSWLQREAGQSLKRYLIEHVLALMQDYSMFVSGLEAKRRSARSLDIQYVRVKGTTDYQVSFNLATMLLLPGLNPQAELQELSALFDSLKPFFERWHMNRPWTVVTNNRDRNRRTYGAMECRYKASDTEKTTTAEEETAQLQARIAASPVLSSWLKTFALDLNKLGPWSWGTFTSEHVFDRDEDPVVRHRHAVIDARRKSESAAGTL